jgi:hypothetical protein
MWRRVVWWKFTEFLEEQSGRVSQESKKQAASGSLIAPEDGGSMLL